MNAHDDDELIRESDLRPMFGDVSAMTIHRWRQNDPDFPEPDFIRVCTTRDGERRQFRFYTRGKIRQYRERKLAEASAAA